MTASADIVPLDASPPPTPTTSVVYSTASTSHLTLDALSRQTSFNTINNDDLEESSIMPSTSSILRPHGIHRVASEQLIPTTPTDLAVPHPAARATSMVMSKVTSRRRQRNPRRFVVTELPTDPEEFLQEPSSPEGRASFEGDPTTTAPVKASKMEVRGRFTIIDLSPDSPATSPQVDGSSSKPLEQMELPRPVRTGSGIVNGAASRMRRAIPPRRFSRSDKSLTTTTSSLPESSVLTAAMLRTQDDTTSTTARHNGNGHSGTFDMSNSRLSNGNGHSGTFDMSNGRPYYGNGHSGTFDYSNGHSSFSHGISPKTPQLSPHGVDLNALDRHLVFLQQESLDMKAVLESMISSNARWISALSPATDNCTNSGKNPKAVHPATSPLAKNSPACMSPVVVVPPVVQEPTLEEKYEKLLAAHNELQLQYDSLSTESAQLKRTNMLLETRLRQETSVNEELRAHVDQLTQYTESLIYSAGEPPPRSQRQRRVESLSSAVSEVATENGIVEKQPPEPDDPATASDSNPPKPAGKHHERTVSELSVDSAATWALENNQSGLEDDDESNIDSDDLDPRDARALKALRRRRWRNVSRSTSMSLEDDSASYTSSSYRDSWVSLFDPQHSSSQTSDWRAMSYDGAESLVDETLFEDVKKPRDSRRSSVDSCFTAVTPPTNNQTDEEPAHNEEKATEEPDERRRKSSALIVEELEKDNPAIVTDPLTVV